MIDRITLLLAYVFGAVFAVTMGCGDLPYDPVDGPDERGLPPAEPVEDSFPSVPESSVAYERVSPDTSVDLQRYVVDTLSSGFELQSLGSSGLAVYTGTYARQDSLIDFDFDAWGSGHATGLLTGDSLDVRYDLVMYLTGFEDATYVRR